MSLLDSWRQRARHIKRDTLALYLACRDPRTPWYAKLFAALVVAYALSPIDLIPDFVPVLGYLDDLIVVPAGIVLAIRMIPSPVLAECRERAQTIAERPTSRAAAALIVGAWLLAAVLVVLFVGYRLVDLVD
jgi:uncharacterized membrane protein YkvA (DUF1232 family)